MAKTKSKSSKSSERSNSKPETRAEEIMSSALVVIRPEATFREAVELLTQRKLTVLPVVSPQNKLLGLLSEEDVLGACDSFKHLSPNFLEKKIKYQKEIQSIRVSETLDQVATALKRGSARHIAVIDSEGILRGMITRRDLIRVLYLRIELSQAIHQAEVVMVI